jgi:hypothetical protein
MFFYELKNEVSGFIRQKKKILAVKDIRMVNGNAAMLFNSTSVLGSFIF